MKMTAKQEPTKQTKNRLAKGKKLGGRPRTTVSKKLSEIPHGLREVAILFSLGHTDEEVGQILGVSEVTINNWKKDKQFALALKKGKEFADAKVEASLYKRALGFEYDEVTYEKSKIGGLGIKLSKDEINDIKNPPKIEAIGHVDTCKTKIVTKLVVADTTAQIFWLKNRKPEEWRDKHEIEGGGDTYLTTIINMAKENEDAGLGTRIRDFASQLSARNKR